MLDQRSTPRGLLALMAAEGTPLDLRSVATALAKRTNIKTTGVDGKGVKSPTKADPKGAKPTTAPRPSTARPSTFWEPVAVVLWQPTWHCTCCGATGSGTPQVMLRERHRRSDLHGGRGGFIERLTAIPSPLHYSHLTREVESSEPTQLRACNVCFGETAVHPQLRLPGIAAPAPTPYTRPPMEKLFDDYAEMRITASSGIPQRKGTDK